MRIKFKKTNARGTASYEAGSEDNPVKYRAKIPMSMLTKGHADLFKENDLIYRLKMASFGDISEQNKPRKRGEVRRFKVCDIQDKHGKVQGEIRRCIIKRFGLFRGMRYHEFDIKGNTFCAHEVGFGKAGLTISIYEKKPNKQIALIELGATSYNSKIEYDIWGVDELSLEIALIFNLFYSFRRFDRRRETFDTTKETHYTYTINKEAKAKYDPMFKEKIKKQMRQQCEGDEQND